MKPEVPSDAGEAKRGVSDEKKMNVIFCDEYTYLPAPPPCRNLSSV